MNLGDPVYVAGHGGMVGSAIVRLLKAKGFTQILVRTHDELDLCDGHAVEHFLSTEKPATVIMSAARVGGIWANNTYPADFLHENLAIAHNVIHSSWRHGVKRFLFLGSSCIYPKLAAQPILEESLLTSSLEPTNEAYALAKIVGLKLCQYYRKQYGVLFHSAMPPNLYGSGDNYHSENSHVIPALIRRFHESKLAGAKEVTIWGTGTPRREFLNVEDLAQALLKLLQAPNPPDWVNAGSGKDVTIFELAQIIQRVVDFEGRITFDVTKPDGAPRKLMDSRYMHEELGWMPQIGLEEGLRAAYGDFLEHLKSGSLRCK